MRLGRVLCTFVTMVTVVAGVGIPLAAPAEARTSSALSAPYPTAVLADSPTAYYRFDETSGSVAQDSSGNGNDGTYVAASLGGSGALVDESDAAVHASARDVVFDQSGDTLPAADAPRTVELWVGYYCCTAAVALLRYGNVAGGSGFEIDLGDNGDSLTVTAGASTVSVSTLSGFRSGWHLLDVSYGGTAVEVYQDGQIIGGGPFGPLATTALGQGLRVAGDFAGMGVDELAIYPTALATARIDAHWSVGASSLGYGACRTAPTTPYAQAVLGDQPLAYYRLDELGAGPGRVAFDSSPHCVNGAYVGSPTSIDGALAGDGDAAVAAGARDYMLSGSDDGLPAGTTSRTFEGWVRYQCCTSAVTLFQYGDVAGGNGFSVALGDNSDSIIVGAGVASVTVGTGGYIRSGWHLLDVSYDGATGTVEVYQDGQVIGGGHLDLGAGTVVPGQGMRMAADFAPMGLDEVAVYASAISPGDIDAHWSTGEAAHGAGPCAAPATSGYSSSVLADAPALYYRMDDLATGAQDRLVLDWSSHCRNAAFDGSSTPADGALPGDPDASTAAGDRQQVLIQSGDTLPAGSSARTFEAWVRYQCCNAAVSLFRYGDVSGGHGFEVDLGDNGDSIVVAAGAATVSAGTVTGFRSGWHLLDVTYDGTTAAIYQDGQLINAGQLGALATALPGQGMVLTSNAQGMGLDEVAVYPAALTPKRIGAHFQAQYLTPAGQSLIAGSVTLSGGGAALGARVQACPTSGAACTVNPYPVDGSGQFHLLVPNGTYTVTIYPPSGSASGPVVLGPYTLPPSAQDLQATFLAPGSLPPGVTVTSPSQGTTSSGGVPTVNWGEPSTFTVTACQGGAGVLYIRAPNTSTGQDETRGIALVETPPGSGTYVANIPPLAPDHGLAGMDPQVACPGHTHLAPDGGPSAGGQHVIIGGSGFAGAKSVKFGSVAASAFSVIGDTLINATVPAGTGSVNVTVVDASNATIDIGSYNYFDVTGIEPTSGPSAGDTLVTIHGSGFDNVAGVLFGLLPARSFSVLDADTIQATAPEGIGTVNVQVVNGLATSVATAATQFTYTGGPAGSGSIVEPYGHGDSDAVSYANQVSNYCAAHDCGAASGLDGVSGSANEVTSTITYGGSGAGGADSGKPEGISGLDWAGFAIGGLGVAAAIICFTPPSAVACGVVGAVLAVAGFGLTVLTLLEKVHICPHIGAFDPFGCNEKVDPSGTVVDTAGNPVNGATATILTQPNGQGAFVAVDPNSGAISPATNPETTGSTGAFDWDAIAGAYKVQASAPDCHAPGDSNEPNVLTPAFLIPPPKVGLVLTLECAAAPPPTPTVSAVQPATGPTSGGTTVDITGTGLAAVTEVDFGGTPASQVQVLSPFAVRAIAPAGTAGAADITVTSAGGISATGDADVFTYALPYTSNTGPTVTGVSPGSGPLTGGTVVTITGTHLDTASEVDFGGKPATSLTPVSATQLQATAPASSFPALVDVTVTGSHGTSPVVAADRFQYGAPSPLSLPSVSGAPLQGHLLTVVPATWTGDPASLHHQWQRCDAAGGSCASVSGATASTYSLGKADVGHTIRVLETATNDVGTSGPDGSATTAEVWTAKFVGTLPAFQLSNRVTVGYTATAGGQPASYDLRYRVAAWNKGFGGYVHPTSWQQTTATKRTLVGSPGHEYCVSVEVRDGSGDVSAWSSEQCTAIALDDRALASGSGWTRATGTAYYLRTVSRTTSRGAHLTLAKAQFGRLALVATVCRTCGKVTVLVNGAVLTTVSTYAAATHNRHLIPLPRVRLKTATVVLRVATSGKPVSVDGLAVSRT